MVGQVRDKIQPYLIEYRGPVLGARRIQSTVKPQLIDSESSTTETSTETKVVGCGWSVEIVVKDGGDFGCLSEAPLGARILSWSWWIGSGAYSTQPMMV